MLTLLKNSHAHALPREVALYVQYDVSSSELQAFYDHSIITIFSFYS